MMIKQLCVASSICGLLLVLAYGAREERVSAAKLVQPKGGGKQASKKEDGPLIVNSQLALTDPVDRVFRNSSHKLYKRKLVKGKTYVITMMSQVFNPYVRLEDAKKSQLAAGTTVFRGNARVATITYTPQKTAEYRIIATTTNGRVAGAFTLTSAIQGKPRTVLNVKSNLAASDPYDWRRTSCRHKVFDVKMIAGKTYTIDMTGGFDTYLRLEDYLGNNRIEDDDGGAGLNSRMVYFPTKSDVHRIICTSCGSNQVGNFTLKIVER